MPRVPLATDAACHVPLWALVLVLVRGLRSRRQTDARLGHVEARVVLAKEYVAKDDAGASKRLGRAKFRATADAEADATLSKDQAILAARERAVNNAIAACESLDRTALGGADAIRVERSRPAYWKEYKRYGDY